MTSDTTHDNEPDDEAQPKYLLTITEAARALEISVRTVQRRLDAGEYEATTVAGKRCVRLSVKDFPDGIPEDVTLDVTGDSVDRTALKSARDTTGDNQRDSTALVPLRDVGGSQVQALVTLIDAVDEARTSRRDSEHKKPTAQESAAKLLLNLEEAQVLTGISSAALRASIQNGELKAKKIGRGWKMRRADLESYLEQIFQ